MDILILQVTWTLYTQDESVFLNLKKMIISQSNWFVFRKPFNFTIVSEIQYRDSHSSLIY